MSKKGRILMAMSGGIDSSVASMMLHDEGYEVIGITMKHGIMHLPVHPEKRPVAVVSIQ